MTPIRIYDDRLSTVRVNRQELVDLLQSRDDMLSALRECVAWFEDNCVDCYALDDAKAALAKARGEQ